MDMSMIQSLSFRKHNNTLISFTCKQFFYSDLQKCRLVLITAVGTKISSVVVFLDYKTLTVNNNCISFDQISLHLTLSLCWTLSLVGKFKFFCHLSLLGNPWINWISFPHGWMRSECLSYFYSIANYLTVSPQSWVHAYICLFIFFVQWSRRELIKSQRPLGTPFLNMLCCITVVNILFGSCYTLNPDNDESL